MADYLSYGDRICLYVDETKGFIFSDYSSSKFNEIRIFKDQDLMNPKDVKNITTIIFEVVLPNRYKLYKNFYKIYGEDALMSVDLDIRLQAEQAKAAVVSEEKDNQLEQKRNFGKAVHYGDIVQLRHVFTQKFIHVNTSKTSNMDKNSMVLSLQSHNSKSAQFKVIPRYKVKYEGEIVQYMDLVSFESVKAPLHFFHTSDFHQIDRFFYGAELNLAVQQSGFTLVRSSKADVEEHDEKYVPYVETGDFVQLVHKEIDGFMESFGPTVVHNMDTKVKLRLRKLNATSSASTHKLSTSAATFWQIEREDQKLLSEFSKWSYHFRFRHATNGQYLCVRQDLRLGLTHKPKPNTVFKLHPNIEQDYIRYNSVFRIEHVLTGTWIHGKREVFNNEEDLIQRSNSTEKTFENLQWEKHEFRDLEGVKQRMYDDAFVIYKVPIHVESAFKQMAGHIPLLRNIMYDRENSVEYGASESYKYKVAIEEIRDDIIVNGVPDKIRQKHMRNLEIVDMIVKIVSVPFYNANDKTFVQKIYMAFYEVLHNYMKGSCLKNSLYFAKYIHLFLPKMLEGGELGSKITEMVTELIKDNKKVLECLRFENIGPFIDSLREVQNPRFLEYLMAFCVCADEAWPSNQRQVAQKWLKEDFKGVYLTDRGQNLSLTPNVLYIKTSPNEQWRKLNIFLEENSRGPGVIMKEFFLKQLDLILSVCHSRNEVCRDLVINKLNYISWEECYTAICSDLLPYYMKTKYFDIIETFFLDIGTNYSVIDSPKYNFIYNQIHGKQATAVECMFSVPAERVTNRIFTDLTNWMFTLLESQQCMYNNNPELNYLTEKVLLLINKLIQYGYFTSATIDRIMKSLVRLLNGKLDLPYEYSSKKDQSKKHKKTIQKFRSSLRYEDSDKNRALVAAKLAGLAILESILIYERVSVVSLLVSKFKQCDKPDEKEQRKRLKGHTHLINCLSHTFEVDKEYQKSPRNARKMVKEIEQLFNRSRIVHPDDWINILIDLSYYESGNMNQMALLILHKIFTLKDSAFFDTYGTFISCSPASRELQEKMCIYIPRLKLIVKSDIGSSQLDVITKVIKDLIRVCRVQDSRETLNPVSQRIIAGYGMLNLCLDIISQIRRSFKKTGLSLSASNVIFLLAELLHHLAVSNSSFQEDLFNCLDTILDLFDDTTHSDTPVTSGDHSTVSCPPIELAQLLREGIFLNNRGFCSRIKAYQLSRLTGIVARIARTKPVTGAAFVQVLHSLVVVDNGLTPLKRNQLLIMKFLMKNFSQIVYVLDSKAMPRLELLSQQPNSDNAMYFNRIVDLFVGCCQGDNQYVQSLCQTIISLEELMELLGEKSVHMIFKRGLLQYFCRVYLSKASLLNREGAVRNFLESTYLEDLLTLLKRSVQLTSKVLEKHEQYDLMDLLGKPQIMKPPAETDIPKNVKMHLENIIYGSSIFMSNLCTACCFLDYTLPVHLMEAVKIINNKILDVFMLLFKFQLNPSTMALITDSMALILPFSEMSSIDAKALLLLHCKPNIMYEDPRKEIDQKHAEEIELNLRFQTFLFNCSQMIAGRNTVKDQLGITIKKEYIQMNDQTSLPLSRDFQSHIRAFINPNISRNDIRRYKDIEVIIRQLESSGSRLKYQKNISVNRTDQDNLDLRCIQILRGLIYNEEVLLPQNWESRIIEPRVQEALKAVEQIQNCLNKFEVSNRTQVHMINPCDNVRKEVVILQSAMLINGNCSVQSSMLNYFLNAKDEVFFGAIRHQLQDAFDDLKDQKLLNSNKKLGLEVENLSFVEGMNKDLDIKEMCRQLRKQLAYYEDRYYIHHRSLALNESFSTRKLRQILASKSEPENNRGCCWCCVPKSRKYEVNDVDNASTGSNGVTSYNGISENVYNNGEGTNDDDLEMSVVVVKDNGKQSTNPNNNSNSKMKHQNGQSDEEEQSENHENCNSSDYASSLAKTDPQQQVKLVLQLLSRMCVGQYHGLQNYLRCQPDNHASVDVVSLVVYFLGSIYSNVNATNIDLNVLAFETIKEAILGNQENRSVVYRAKVVDYANFIIRNIELRDTCDEQKLLQLYLSISRVIVALIEENGPEETALAKEIRITIDIKAVFDVMHYCQLKIDLTKDSALKESIYEVGFNYYIIIARCDDLDGGKAKKDVQPAEHHEKAVDYFKKGAASIEILKNKTLQRVHFHLKTKEILRESAIEKVKWSVDRTSPSNKIRSFMTWSKLIVPDMAFQRRVISSDFLQFLTKSWDAFNIMMTLLSLTICALLLVGVEAPDKGYIGLNAPDKAFRDPAFDYRNIIWNKEIYHKVVIGLGSCHFVFCVLLLFVYVITNRPTLRTITGYFKTIKMWLVGLVKKSDFDDEVNHKERSNVSLFSIFQFLYLCICLGLSIYGYWIPYLYAFHLFNIIQNNQVLKGVIAAVTTNGRVLIWVMILMIIVLYIFSIFAFCFFRSTFQEDNNLYAKSLLETFVTIIRFGVIGDLFENMMPNDEEKKTIQSAVSRFGEILAFSIIFFIVITITGMNIVFGIIVDSFSELRDAKFKAEKDMKAVCFICSRPGHDFDHSRSNFSKHVAEEHNMWTYLFYILHLKEKNLSDYNHLDLHVANMLKKDNYDFFPINCALSLTTDEIPDSKIDEIYRRIEQVKTFRENEEREKVRHHNMLLQNQWHTSNQVNGSVSSSSDDENTESFHPDMSSEVRPSTNMTENSTTTNTPSGRRPISSLMRKVRDKIPSRNH